MIDCEDALPVIITLHLKNPASESTVDPKGCEKNCINYHPKLCIPSIQTKECARQKCKLSHVFGTKKTWQEKQTKTGSSCNKSDSQQSASQDLPAQSAGNQKDFLDLRALFLTSLQAMELRMEQRLNSIEAKTQTNLNPYQPQISHSQRELRSVYT